jgi:GxxExxY protein
VGSRGGRRAHGGGLTRRTQSTRRWITQRAQRTRRRDHAEDAEHTEVDHARGAEDTEAGLTRRTAEMSRLAARSGARDHAGGGKRLPDQEQHHPALACLGMEVRWAHGLLEPDRMPRSLRETTGEIIDAAVKLHVGLGPGLLESVYQAVLARDLERRGLLIQAGRTVPFEFDGMRFSQGLSVDLLVEGQVVVELKSMEKIAPVHFKQVLTYLRLLNLRVGLLINFGAPTLKEGLHRIVNGYRDDSDTAVAAGE